MELLPEECIAAILCCTTPVDAARLSSVSKSFCSAADSDVVWDCFLPSDYHSIVSESPLFVDAPSKKATYLALSDHPVIVDQGKKSFQLEKKSGKKCYMLAARALSFADAPGYDGWNYWDWITSPESRFPEVAELNIVWYVGVSGMINTLSLSPNTLYAAFLVFKSIYGDVFYYDKPVGLSVSIVSIVGLNPYLDQLQQHYRVDISQCPTARSDGWLEIEMGEFFNSGLKDEELHMRVLENRTWSAGLSIEGIEVRPKGVD